VAIFIAGCSLALLPVGYLNRGARVSNVERGLDAAVAEEILNQLRMDAHHEQGGRGGVPQIMDANAPEPRLL
jgi:hypothetical protein